MPDELIPNGVDGSTGRYLPGPASQQELIDRVGWRPPLTAAELREHKWWTERYGLDDPDRMPVEGVEPKSLASAGWGVIFGPEIKDDVRSALEPLLSFRRGQVGPYFKSCVYQRGWSKQDFLAQYRAGPGQADPRILPYYLLIVGDPQSVPYRFQYELDVQYAVGRIFFETADEYKRYAESVVNAETKSEHGRRSRQLTFFGVSNDDDRATRRTRDELIVPLAREIENFVEEKKFDWSIRQVLGKEANKQQLAHLLGGGETPAFLFTASHGMGFPLQDSRQLAEQGSLLCQDWPGPKAWSGDVPREHYFAAADLGSDADVHGLISFHFACYSAGTPEHDSFLDPGTVEPRQIADRPFLARLAQSLLAHPRGGALAVVGHIDRAWTTSFNMSEGGQIQTFASAIKRLLKGHPVGSAMEYVNQRYAELSVDLAHLFEDRQLARSDNRGEFALTWVANNDAQGFIVLGDPAVRLEGAGELPSEATADSTATS